jgi:phosphate starvation-inducible PhoH-like protein
VVRQILRNVEDVHFAELSSSDVVRHRLVADIVDAYSRYDEAREQESTQSATTQSVRAVPGRAAGGGRAGRRR